MPKEQADFSRFWFNAVIEPSEAQLIDIAVQLTRLSGIYTPGTLASNFPASFSIVTLRGRADCRRVQYQRTIRAFGNPNRFGGEDMDPTLTLKEKLTLNLEKSKATGIHRVRSFMSIVPYEKHIEHFVPVSEATAILSDIAASNLPNGRYTLHPKSGMALNSWKLQAAMRPDYG